MAGESGKTEIDVAAITKSVTEAVTESLTKSITESVTKTVTEQMGKQIDEVVKNQKILSDTIAADKKTAEAPAKASEPLTEEAIDKRVQAGVEAALKARDEAAGKTADRQKLIEKIKTEKLGGDDDLAALLVGDDEAALTASAEKLATKIKTFKPDFGGAKNEGGDTPAGVRTSAAAPIGNLSPGTAKFAAGIKLPT